MSEHTPEERRLSALEKRTSGLEKRIMRAGRRKDPRVEVVFERGRMVSRVKVPR